MNKTLIVITGPTAIGKTNLSIKLATYFKCEIISADSRQFYKEMRIGTAVPSTSELQQARHHCIQHKSIHDTYTVGDFEQESLAILKSLFAKNNMAILVGGSGLYIKAVTDGLDDFPDVNPNIRKELQEKLNTQGIRILQKQLKELDIVTYNKIDLDNPQRIMRALEVCIGTGTPYSSFLNTTSKQRPFNVIKIGITAERKLIYNRIEQRVDLMIAEGLVNEVKNLYPYQDLNTLNTVGYKEIFNYLDQEIDLNFAISEIKKNTRRFAKRQLTWFRKDPMITWFDYLEDLDVVIKHIKKHCR